MTTKKLLKKIWLFVRIVFRDFHGVTIDPKTAWQVASIVHED